MSSDAGPGAESPNPGDEAGNPGDEAGNPGDEAGNPGDEDGDPRAQGRSSLADDPLLVRTGRALFGDRVGLAIFLAAVVFLGALWRVDFLLTDSETVANLLANVAEGRLSVVDAPYSLTAGQQPGLVEVDGRLYGRNYGQVYLAVPVLWALDALAGLVDLRLLLAGCWTLALVGLARTVGTILDRPRVADGGAAVGLALFAVSMLVATGFGWFERPRPMVALGATTVLLAAVAATALYRLLAWANGRRVGLVGGLALVAASPIGFWASFPKRHVLSVTAVLLVCLLFAASRGAPGRRSTLARAGAYAVVGYFASVHAFEAAFVLAVLAPLDLLTAPSNDRRTLALVAAVFLVAMTPMLATNAAISGDPFAPPRTLPGADGALQPDAGGGQAAPGSGGDSGGSDGSSSSGDGLPIGQLLGPLAAIVGTVAWVLGYMLETVVAGLATLTEPDRLWHVFVRSGWIPGVRYHANAFEAYELTVLEALPLLGALAWLPVAVASRLAEGASAIRARLRAGLADPVRQTDVLVGGLAVTVLVVYLPLLPLFSTITVRYVVPAFPLLLYAVFRLGPVRAGIRDAPRALGVSYGVAVVAGGLGGLVVLWTLAPAVGEAVQLHALVGLGTAVLLGAVTATWQRHRRPALVASALGVAAGATTLLLVLAALSYFADGTHALDVARLLSEFVGPPG